MSAGFTGLLDKLRLGVLASANAILDRVIDMNSVEAVKEQVRALEEARDQLRQDCATAEGSRRSLQREVLRADGAATATEENIRVILGDSDPSNDHFAAKLAEKLVGMTEDRKAKAVELDTAKTTATALAAALERVNVKLEQMRRQIDSLNRLERESRSNERAAEAVERATELTAEGAEARVDDVAAALERRAETSRVRLEQAMEGAGTDGGVSPEAAAILARIKGEMTEA